MELDHLYMFPQNISVILKKKKLNNHKVPPFPTQGTLQTDYFLNLFTGSIAGGEGETGWPGNCDRCRT